MADNWGKVSALSIGRVSPVGGSSLTTQLLCLGSMAVHSGIRCCGRNRVG